MLHILHLKAWMYFYCFTSTCNTLGGKWRQTLSWSATSVCQTGECPMDFHGLYPEKEARKVSGKVIRGTSANVIPGVNNKKYLWGSPAEVSFIFQIEANQQHFCLICIYIYVKILKTKKYIFWIRRNTRCMQMLEYWFCSD